MGFREALAKYNIKFVPNLEGDCDVLVAKYLANSLNFSLEKNASVEEICDIKGITIEIAERLKRL